MTEIQENLLNIPEVVVESPVVLVILLYQIKLKLANDIEKQSWFCITELDKYFWKRKKYTNLVYIIMWTVSQT